MCIHDTLTICYIKNNTIKLSRGAVARQGARPTDYGPCPRLRRERERAMTIPHLT